MKYLPLVRRTCQIFVLALFCALPFLVSLGFTGISGTFFSLDFFGLPFADPASTLQILGEGLLEGNLPLYTVLAGAALSLLLAFLLGRVFCGWACPYGLFSELVAKRQKPWKHARNIRLIVFICAVVLAILSGYPIISWLSMPGQITLAPLIVKSDWKLALFILLLPFLALCVDLLMRRRFFCSTLCPQSLLLGLGAALAPRPMPALKIMWNRDKCACKGAPCEKACQLGLAPRKKLPRSECVMCGNCVAACSERGKALKFTLR